MNFSYFMALGHLQMLEEENEDDEVDEGFDKTTSPTLRMRLEAVDDVGPECDGK